MRYKLIPVIKWIDFNGDPSDWIELINTGNRPSAYWDMD